MQLRFVARVSDEMRTPLTVIRGAVQNMGSDVVRDLNRYTVRRAMIVQDADQLGERVEQVLTFASAQKHDTLVSTGSL